MSLLTYEQTKRAVMFVREQGLSQSSIADFFGVSRISLMNHIKAYEENNLLFFESAIRNINSITKQIEHLTLNEIHTLYNQTFKKKLSKAGIKSVLYKYNVKYNKLTIGRPRKN